LPSVFVKFCQFESSNSLVENETLSPAQNFDGTTLSKFNPGNSLFVMKIVISEFERSLSVIVGREFIGISEDKTSFEIRLAIKRIKNTKLEYALNLIEQISSKHCVF
jgi:hypothetical protein